MKKFLLSMAAMLMVAISANAQIASAKRADAGTLQQDPYPTSLVPKGFRAPANKIQLADNQLVMGPYTTDQVATSNQGLGVTGVPGTLGAYVELPYSVIEPFDGGQVVKMRVGLAQSTTISHIYIIPFQGGNLLDPIVSQAVSSNKAGWNEFTLTTPVTLNLQDYDGVLMGYDYRQTASNYPMSCVNAGADMYNLYIYGNLGQGVSYYDMGNTYGNLSVQAIVEGDFVENKAMPQAIGNIIIPFGIGKTQTLSVINVGTADLQSIDYVISIDGVAQPEQHAELASPVVFGDKGEVEVFFEAAPIECTQEYSLTVTKVNGEDNDPANATISGQAITTTKLIQRRVTVEEFTGLTCPWCPRGIVGMEMMRNRYGDQLVQVAVHQYSSVSQDAMTIAANKYARLNSSGAPSCMLDRMGEVDPYYGANGDNFGISQVLDALLAQPAFVGVTISGQWNEDSTQVVATAVIDPLFDASEYDVEMVLIGDSLTGTGSGWTQLNNYASYPAAQAGPDLADWCQGGKNGKSSVTGLYFNDVALASSYKNGRNQIERQTYSATQPTEVTCTMALPTTPVSLKNALRRDNMYVAALVIDPATGFIVNAAKTQLPCYADEEPQLLDLTINHERPTKLGYTPTEAIADFTEAKAFLGVDALSTDMLYIEKPDGERILFNADNSAADGYDGWFDGEGNPTKWGADTKICVKFFEALANDGAFTFYDMNGADEVGKTYTVKWVLVNGEKAVRYTINVTFVEVQQPEYKPEIIATIDVPVQMLPATAYEAKTATFPVDEVANALGISISDAAQYIVNVTDGNFVENTTDGWRDANGDACLWAELNGTAPGVCVKISNPASGIIDYMGAIDNSYQEGDTYVAKWGFVNADEKAVVLNVNITFTEGINNTVSVSTSSDLTDGTSYFALFSCDQALDFTDVEDVEAYAVTKQLEAVETPWGTRYNMTGVVLTKVDKVPANTGVLLRSSAASLARRTSGDPLTFDIPVADGEVAPLENNDLVANPWLVDASFITFPEDEEAEEFFYPFVLGTNLSNGSFGFVPACDPNDIDDETGWWAQGKYFLQPGTAYLPLDFSLVVPSTVFTLEYDGGPVTGINDVQRSTLNAQRIYDLQGRRIDVQRSTLNAQRTKGLYIINGKKVLVK